MGSFRKFYKPADVTSRWEYLHHGNRPMLQIGVVSRTEVIVTLYRCQHDVSPFLRGGDVLAPIPRPPHTPTGSRLNTHTLFLGHEHLYLPGPEQPHPRDVLTRDKVRLRCEGMGGQAAPKGPRPLTDTPLLAPACWPRARCTPPAVACPWSLEKTHECRSRCEGTGARLPHTLPCHQPEERRSGLRRET